MVVRTYWANRLLARSAEALAGIFNRGWPRDLEALIARLAAQLPAGTEDAADGLAALVRACAQEANLSAIGLLALRWDIARKIANLQRLAAMEAADPAILRSRIGPPLVVTGLPRSGTTFLQRLLLADPAAFAPRCWETIYPYPDPGRPDRRARQAGRELRRFAWLAPDLRGMHPLDSASPQECSEITAQVFQSLRFEMLYSVPGYKAWLQARGHDAAYRFHRRFLQHLQYQRGRPGRWVLKSPDHVFALDALRRVYPDARLVFLHRDPLRVLPSVAKLTEIVRAPFARTIDRAAIGRQVMEDWARGAAILAREAAAPSFPPAQVLHLTHRSFVGDPEATVRRIYRHFGMGMSAATAAAVAHLAAALPHGGYAEHHYSFAAHGIAPEEIRARFAGYMRAVALPGADAAWRRRAVRTVLPQVPELHASD